MKRADIIIGIDPDTERSGCAYLETASLEASNMTFPQLLDYLKFIAEKSKESEKSVIVVVEAGWLNPISNYHTAADRKGQRIAKNVGANHQVGKNIVSIARSYGLEVLEQKPLRKIWRKGKISMDELNSLLISKKMGTLDRKVSQDVRDAVLISLLHAGIL